ncbi:hypothetical protein [Fischerella thermalis]|uniref:hypothetical protein n=1 Tax=Fischerella thermalis TaxID=372787 RepID=UPI0015E1516F|nr:hypothetical protein [Fischerella thermalis]
MIALAHHHFNQAITLKNISLLDKLEKTRDIIYYRPETKTYCFWEDRFHYQK